MSKQIPAYIRHRSDCTCNECVHPALAWNVDVELHPDGYFCAVDLDVVDSVGEDGRYPAGYGRTPLAAIVELLDEMGGVT